MDSITLLEYFQQLTSALSVQPWFTKRERSSLENLMSCLPSKLSFHQIQVSA